jgi:hypothetical protein
MKKTLAKSGKNLSLGLAILVVDNATMNADTISIQKQKIKIENSEKKNNQICTLEVDP